MGASTRGSFLSDSLRAHALLFEQPFRPRHDAAAGARMLAAFVLVGAGVFYALDMALGGTPIERLGFVAVLIAAFVAAHLFVVRVPFATIGLRPWSTWSRRERLYLLQVAPIAAIAFAFVFQAHLRVLLERHGLGGFVLYAVVTGLAWGIAQELLYRGWLQTELVRRFGAIAGVLVANVLFTVGPLHTNWYSGDVVQWGMLGAIFAIGLVFGVLYQRSGNLWIPAVLHGLWPLNMS